MWITIAEVCLIWGKWKRSIELAIWNDKIKARKTHNGKIWLVEFESVVAHWGQPLRPDVVEEIRHDVQS